MLDASGNKLDVEDRVRPCDALGRMWTVQKQIGAASRCASSLQNMSHAVG
jgi:hypothetical protein